MVGIPGCGPSLGCVTVPEPSWRRSRRDGYPLGGSTLVLKSTPSRVDMDLACTIEDGHGREVGSVQVVPSKSSGWQQLAQLLELRDAWGRDVGRLLQNNGYLSGLRTFALQSGGKDLGRTTFDDWQRVDGAFGENARRTVTILDVNDRVVAGITERRTTMQFIGNDFYDYTPEFEYPPYGPVGSMCLVAALAEYFHRRSEHGGMLRGIPGV